MTIIAKLDQSASWDLITNSNDFPNSLNPPTSSQGQTISPAVDPSSLTWFVRFTPSTLNGGPLDGSTVYALNNFSFDIQNTTSIGSATSGAGAGKVTLEPLNLVLTDPSLTPALFQMLAAGSRFSKVDILGYRQDGTLTIDDSFRTAFASNLAFDSSSETALALQYGQLLMTTTPVDVTKPPISTSWDVVTNAPVGETALALAQTVSPAASTASTDSVTSAASPASQASVADPGSLTWFVRFTQQSSIQGETAGPLDGTLYALNSFSFDVQNPVTIGSATTGAGAGKVKFDPLNLELTDPSLTPSLFRMLATGESFSKVDVLGYRQDGSLAIDDSFRTAFASNLSFDSSSETALALQYGQLAITTTPVDPTGSPVTGSWDMVTNAPVDETALAQAQTVSPAASTASTDSATSAASPASQAPVADPGNLTYFVRFTPSTLNGGPLDGSTVYALNDFSFDIQNTTSIGSATTGAGAGKVTLEPLNLVLTDPSLTPPLFGMLAAGSKFNKVDILGYRQDGTLAIDDSFRTAFASKLALDSSGETALALQYGQLLMTTAPVDVTKPPISTSWDVVTNAPVGETALALAQTVSPAASTASTDSLTSAASPASATPAADPGNLTYFVRFTPKSSIQGETTDNLLDGSTLYALDSFSFDVENPVTIGSATSGAGAGKVKFDPLNLEFTDPSLTPSLFHMLAAGSEFSKVDVLGYRQDGSLAIDDSFRTAFASNLAFDSTSETSLALQYGQLLMTTTPVDPTGSPVTGSWDMVTNAPVDETALAQAQTVSPAAGTASTDSLTSAASPASATPAADPGNLTYFVRFTPSTLNGPLDGSTVYALNNFSFDIQNTTSIGSATTGAGAGKVTLEPLNLVLTDPSLTPPLFGMLAAGSKFNKVDILGYRQDGTLAIDDSFRTAFASKLAFDSSGETALALQYGQLLMTTAPVDVTKPPISTSWDVVTNAPVDETALAPAQTVSPAASTASTDSVTSAASPASQVSVADPGSLGSLTYFVRFTPQSSIQGETAGPLNGSTLYQLNSFSFDVQNPVTIGSATTGAGAGKVKFDPLNLVLTQSLLTPRLFQMIATGTALKQVDVLGYRQDGTLAIDDSFGLVFGKDLSTDASGATTIALAYGQLSFRNYGELDLGTFTPATPDVVEQSQTTVVGTVTLGFAGETLSLTQTAGSGTLALGAVSGGVQQVIYTAPSSIDASTVDPISYTITDQSNDTVATQSSSVQLDAGPTIAAATPDAVEKAQTTVVATVTPGLPGDTLTLTQNAGSGTLTLAPLSGGVQQVIYTAPSSVAASTVDALSYTISDQHNDVTATGSASVQLDAGPTIAAATPNVVEKSQTTVVATVMPGLPGDTLTLTQNAGSGTLALGPVSGGVQQVIYTAPSAIAASAVDALSYSISDQHNDAVAAGSANVQLDSGPKAGNAHLYLAPGQSVDLTNVLLGLDSRGLPGDTLTLSAVDASGTQGSVTLNNGDLSYISPTSGTVDAFTYTVSDEHQGTAIGSVSVSISASLSRNANVVLTGSGNIVVGQNGNDTVTGGTGSASVMLGNGNDSVSIGGSGNVIVLGNGNDTVTVGAGNAQVSLGNGNDKVSLSGTGNVVTAGNGNDIVTGGTGNATITLGNGNNNVQTSGLNNKITVGSGNNTIVAGTGSDWVSVNGGHDTLTFAGASNHARLLGATDATIVDNGTGLEIEVWSGLQRDTLVGFGTDGHGLIDFVNGAGGFTSVQAILDGLHSDNHGGTILSLGGGGSIDFVGTPRSQLSASNFALLGQFIAGTFAPAIAGQGGTQVFDPSPASPAQTLTQPHHA